MPPEPENGGMEEVRLSDYGLTEAIVTDIRAREQRQFQFFVKLTAGGCGLLWLVLTALIYANSARRAPLLGLVVSPLLGLLGAGIGALPVMIVSALLSPVLCPRHAQAKALERYEAAASRIRACDVCVLARGDHSPKREVAYCAICDAWLCPECRQRYDLRAVAVLKRAVRSPAEGKDQHAAGSGGS